ncbi:MAG: UMP kinase [Bacteroidales bacterium]|jgi:uridylate kinase|nr:UMP kinase [Bacteroidales bacterium]
MKRILLKLSGESLMGNSAYGLDSTALAYYAGEIKKIVDKKIELGIVVGGGNIFRGVQGSSKGFDRIQGDYMGMLATTINSIAIQSVLSEIGIKTKLMSGLPIERVAEAMSSKQAIEYLEEGFVVIISGGSGNPFFTTDTAAVLRALEIKANVIIKGTRVDGVYDKDPEKYKDAVKYDSVSFDEAIEKNLRIMDQTAFTLCKENNLPIIVFDVNKEDNLVKLVSGEKIGTIVE